MTQPHLTNVAASVHQRLLNLSQSSGEQFNLILSRYVYERLLYRLVQAGYGERFVLKGAMLLALWGERLQRPTHDLDLLAYGPSTQEEIASIFRTICGAAVAPDGLEFNSDSIRISPLRGQQAGGGQRVELYAGLGPARIPLQIDVGLGDAVLPSPRKESYPCLLPFPPAVLYVYPKEAVVAEKLHAMAELGMLNSRMKDFYDIWGLCRNLPFDGESLTGSIRATFGQHKMAIPSGGMVALTADFSHARDKIAQWATFLTRIQIEAHSLSLDDVVGQLRIFLVPPLEALADNAAFSRVWPPGGPWQDKAIAKMEWIPQVPG